MTNKCKTLKKIISGRLGEAEGLRLGIECARKGCEQCEGTIRLFVATAITMAPLDAIIEACHRLEPLMKIRDDMDRERN